MFTGLIEHIGRVQAIRPTPAGRRMAIDLGPLSAGLQPGHSIAVDGVCLTVSTVQPSRVEFDLVRTTLETTTLGNFSVGTEVNLERPITLQSPIGGHLVAGHIDGLGTLEAFSAGSNSRLARFRAPSHITDLIIAKGSLTINGVSLTVTELTEGGFGVALIPETLQRSNLGHLRPGQKVNIETDLIGKYVAKFLSVQPQASLSEQVLREHGFV